MTIASNKQEIQQSIVTSPILDASQEFNWKHCWYPVAFVQDLPKHRPYSFSLYDEAFVLFRNQDGKLSCLKDICPHRAAKLSDGQLIDGKLECLYHGWQFGSAGQCLHIPQLPADAKIPAKACVKSFEIVERQGIVWVWPGESEAADKEAIPTIAELDNPELVITDFMCDVPYSQNTFIENILDVAHVPINHEGTLGKRTDAQPLEMEVLESSLQGVHGRFRKMGMPNIPWREVYFVAPYLVFYTYRDEQRGWSWGSATYSIPLNRNRCRALFRTYRNFSTWQLKLKPRWQDHCYRLSILEQDVQQLMGQQVQIEQLGQSIKKLYLPIKTCDLIALEYRKWLDKYGSSFPFYRGYTTSNQADDNGEFNHKPVPPDRFSQHTQMCSSCNQTYQLTNRVKQTASWIAISLAALAILTNDSWISPVAVFASLSAVALAFVAQKVKAKLERGEPRFFGMNSSPRKRKGLFNDLTNI